MITWATHICPVNSVPSRQYITLFITESISGRQLIPPSRILWCLSLSVTTQWFTSRLFHISLLNTIYAPLVIESVVECKHSVNYNCIQCKSVRRTIPIFNFENTWSKLHFYLSPEIHKPTSQFKILSRSALLFFLWSYLSRILSRFKLKKGNCHV